MELLRKLNGFFFDIEEGEPSDWLSVSLFYGAVAVVPGLALIVIILDVLL